MDQFTSTRVTSVPLDDDKTSGKLRLLGMATQIISVTGDETQREFEYPQREAAFFTASFCGAIPPKNSAAILKCRRMFWLAGTGRPSANPVCVRFWSGWWNIGDMSWRFSTP